MLSFPANPTNGTQYTDNNGKVWEYDGVKWNIATTAGIKQFLGAKIYLTQDYALTDVLTEIDFDGLSFDTSNFYNISTPSQLVIPRTGYYRISLLALTGQEGSGASYQITLKRNTIELFNSNMAAFQSGTYNEVLLLNVGDTVTLFASGTENTETLLQDSFIEIELVGYTFGATIAPGFEFSGAKADIGEDVLTTSTPTAISWAEENFEFNTNANAAGNVYWSIINPTRFTISTTAYYNIKAFFETTAAGSADSYTVTLKRNNSTNLETITLGGNESAELDEVYQLNSNDYLEIFVSNSENLGSIKATSSFIEIIRLGV